MRNEGEAKGTRHIVSVAVGRSIMPTEKPFLFLFVCIFRLSSSWYCIYDEEGNVGCEEMRSFIDGPWFRFIFGRAMRYEGVGGYVDICCFFVGRFRWRTIFTRETVNPGIAFVNVKMVRWMLRIVITMAHR